MEPALSFHGCCVAHDKRHGGDVHSPYHISFPCLSAAERNYSKERGGGILNGMSTR